MHPSEGLVIAWNERPYEVAVAVTLIPVGALSLAIGADVSAALTELTAEYVTRAMGLLLFLGGLFTMLGVVQDRWGVEAVGQGLMAAGANTYGLGVLVGLGVHGLVAGPGYIAIAIAALRRLQVLLALDRRDGG